MRNLNDEDDNYDYSPNQLAELSVKHNEKYRQIVNSNLDSGDTIEAWEQRNLAWAKKMLDQQK